MSEFSRILEEIFPNFEKILTTKDTKERKKRSKN